MPPERISACLIVQDEQERIGAALASVAFCDETIVVDGGSRDETVMIAKAAGARVIENPWPGFAAQRNVALDAASCDWVIEIDADERVSPELRASIQALLEHPPAGAGMAVCALRHRFLGGLLGPSAKYPAYRARIFRRGAYRHDESRAVHEGVEPHERPVVLDGDFEHELADTLHEAFADTWRYARLESQHVSPPRTLRAGLIGTLLRPAAKFVYRTFVDGGWRDGWRGMLKISLDAGTDALVWTLSILRGGQGEVPAGAEGALREGHFGRRPVGPAKVVALSGGGKAAEAAEQWLSGLRERGLDVALVSTATVNGEGVSLQSVERLSPLRAIRALEIEMQLRTIDAVVSVGGRARLTLKLVPRTLRPEIEGLDVSLDPRSAAELVRAAIVRR
ncbi:MAG: glycosyltransferase family 2 protein [Solirubrobacteraceae bacterium]